MVDRDGLVDLAADGHDRVERREGVLEDDGEVVAAQPLQVALGPPEQLVAPEPDRPADLRACREQPEHGEGGDRLAGPGLPDDAEHLVLPHLEGEVVDGVEDAVVGRELNREVLHGEQRRGHVDRGSNASRSPSPRKFTARTVRRMASPGK